MSDHVMSVRVFDHPPATLLASHSLQPWHGEAYRVHCRYCQTGALFGIPSSVDEWKEEHLAKANGTEL